MKSKAEFQSTYAIDNIVLFRDHPGQSKAANRWFVFFTLLIPFMLSMVNFMDRSDTWSWYFNLLFELGMIVLGGFSGVLLFFIAHALVKWYFEGRNRDQSVYLKYNSIMDSFIFLIFIVSLVLIFGYFDLDQYLGSSVPLVLLPFYVIVYFYFLGSIIHEYGKKSGYITVYQLDNTLYLEHGFKLWKLSFRDRRSFMEDEPLHLAIMTMVEENDGRFIKSKEYQTLPYEEIPSHQMDLAIYLPITKKQLILVDNDLSYTDMNDLLIQLDNFSGLKGVLIDLPKSNSNPTDYNQGLIDIGYTVESQTYELSLKN